jgi:beta-lactamase class A
VEDEAAFAAGLNNRVTADGLVGLFRLIEERRALSPAAADAMLGILHRQAFRSGIPAGVPETVRIEAQFAHKTGEMSTVTHDAGLVYLPDRAPYAVAILTEWTPDAAGDRRAAVAQVSRAVYRQLAERA